MRNEIAAYTDGMFTVPQAVVVRRSRQFMLVLTISVCVRKERMRFQERRHAEFGVSLSAATNKFSAAERHANAQFLDLRATWCRFFEVIILCPSQVIALSKLYSMRKCHKPFSVYCGGQQRRRPVPSVEVPDALARVVAANRPLRSISFIEAVERWFGRLLYNTMPRRQKGDANKFFNCAGLMRILAGSFRATWLETGIGSIIEGHSSYHVGANAS